MLSEWVDEVAIATELIETTLMESTELTATESTELTVTELIETTAAAEETKRTAQTARSASADPSTCRRDGGNSLHSNPTTMTEQGSAETRSAAGSRSPAARGSSTPLLSSVG